MKIEKKIMGSRCSVRPFTQTPEMLEKIIHVYRQMLNILLNKKNISIVGCYSYDLIPTVNMDEELGKYILTDLHLIDFYADFAYLMDNFENTVFQAFVYKYLAEIEYKKSNDAASTMYSILYQNMQEYVHRKEDKQINKAFVCNIFTLFHELIHCIPDDTAYDSFVNMFENDAKKDLDLLNLKLKGKVSMLITEGHCDFAALTFIMIFNSVDSKMFNLERQELYETCVMAIIALFVLEMLNNTTIDNLNSKIDIVPEAVIDRINILNVFTRGMGRDDFVFHGLDAKSNIIRGMKTISEIMEFWSDILSDLPSQIDSFNVREDRDELIKKRCLHMSEQHKNKWVYIE